MSYFIISLKNELVYRFDALWHIIGSVCQIYCMIALWTWVYQADSSMLNYMTAYTILSNIIQMFYNNEICDQIGDSVCTGKFSIDLIRPVNYLWINFMQISGSTMASFLLAGIPVMLFFSPYLVKELCLSWSIPAGILAVLLGYILLNILFSLVGFLAFIVTEVWPFRRLVSDTIRFLSGSFLPLALFPSWLRRLAYVTPFPWLYSFPLQLFTGKLSMQEAFGGFLILSGWIAGLGILLLAVYSKAINRATVQGG